jgi:hypothetical protein
LAQSVLTITKEGTRESNRKSIAAEVIGLLEQFVPTAAELKRREEFFQRALKMSQAKPLTPGPFPSAEEMVREDRER